MASLEQMPDIGVAAPPLEGGRITQSINTQAITAPSISPMPSSNPLLYASPTSTQVPGELDGWDTANKGPKNAKEYWKEAYAISMQSGQTDSKRKHNSGTGNGERAKRHRGEHANEGPRVPQAESPDSPPNDAEPSGYVPTVSTVEQANSPTRSGGFQPTEKDIELRQFLKVDVDLDNPQARGDLDRIYNAAVSFGQGKCKLVGGKWQLDNFGTSLYHHQLIGVSWMLSRELHPAAPAGGILADEMGLGKTVQLLACMSQNMPGKSSKASKTLIITPKRLTTQWYNEINAHCSHKRMKRAYVYAASSAMIKSQWEEATIILTNYNQLQRQIPLPAKLRYIEKLKRKGDAKWKDQLRRHSRGGLFEVDWHRVVLDEAHAISNRNSQTSRACRLLLRRYSWVLSGTPLTNDTDEFFPYLDFIRSKYSDFGEYHDDMGDITNEGQRKKLRELYQEISLRRCVQDKLLGQPILQIPENRPTELITVEFSPIESDLYRRANEKLQQLRERAKNRKPGDGSEPIPKGELRKWFNYLRYFTSHPALVEPTYISHQVLRPLAPGITGVEQSTAVQEKLETGDTPAPYYFCRVCCNALVEPRIGDCGHAFCRTCVKKTRAKSRQGCHCLSCGKAPGAIVSVAGKEYHHHTLDYFRTMKREFGGLALSSEAKREKRVRKPGDDEFGFQPRLSKRKKAQRKRGRAKKSKKGKKGKVRQARTKKDENEQIRSNALEFLQACDKRPWEPIPHSAKTKATMALVDEWQQEAPEDKIIIFIQWIPMLSILGRMLFQNGLKYVYLCGEMGSNDQEMCIRVFQGVPEIKVMLISVSCGAHGLNLTAANRAIVFDHWWHEGLERQAFARVHRIGQTKQVCTAKLVAAGSMDETILGMQARKRETIGSAVGDGDSHLTYDDDGNIDGEMLELTRLDDISDEESELGVESDDESSSDTDGDTDSADSSGGDEEGDEEDSDYEGPSDTEGTVGSIDRPKSRSGGAGEAQDEESEEDMDPDTEDE